MVRSDDSVEDLLKKPDQQAVAKEKMLKASLSFFASERISGPDEEPYYGKFLVADHHIEWDKLLSRHNRLLIRASRDHGKSYFLMAYMIWKAEYYSVKEIYLFSSTQSLAEDRLNDLKNELLNNDKHAHLLPAGNLNRLWSKREITLSNGTVIRARGWGVRVRGGHPPIIVCDDVLDDNSLYSETARFKSIDYFFSVPSNMILKKGQLVVCGTPFAYGDLYDKIEETGKYACSTFPARVKRNGKVCALFPERYSLEELQNKEEEITTPRFTREFMCQPMSDDMSLFPSKLFNAPGVRVPYKLGLPYNYWVKRGCRLYSGVDVAFSAETNADWFVIFTIAVDEQGNRWIVNITRKQGLGFQQQIDAIKEEYALMRPEVFHIESNQGQRLMPDDVRLNTDIPIRLFWTTGQQPKQPWNRGMTRITAGKHDLDKGVPSLRMTLENGKWRIPRGDENSIELTDRWIGEMNCITWDHIKGQVLSVGEHDDTVMASWMADTAVQLGGIAWAWPGDNVEEQVNNISKELKAMPTAKELTGKGNIVWDLSVDIRGEPEPWEKMICEMPGVTCQLMKKESGEYIVENGLYRLRLYEGDPNFVKFAINKQGYGSCNDMLPMQTYEEIDPEDDFEDEDDFDPFGLKLGSGKVAEYPKLPG